MPVRLWTLLPKPRQSGGIPENMNRLVTIVGPTGIGKSRLALHLAQVFNGEIISADSRQVYLHMDIGTAKPGTEEMALVPHHLVNMVNPDDDFSLAQYQRLAYRAINDIQEREKLPVLVGGSGQHIWAVLEGWRVPQVPPDPEFRHQMEQSVADGKTDEAYQELMRVDPDAARKIGRHNTRRIIRALEVHRQTNTPISQLQHKETPPFEVLTIGLTADRAELYHRIDRRVDEMIERGLVAETEKLVNMGYGFYLPAMSSIGYKQIGTFLNDGLNLATVIQHIKYETHRFVRHQYTWFRLTDDRIHWFDIQKQNESEIAELLTSFIKGE